MARFSPRPELDRQQHITDGRNAASILSAPLPEKSHQVHLSREAGPMWRIALSFPLFPRANLLSGVCSTKRKSNSKVHAMAVGSQSFLPVVYRWRLGMTMWLIKKCCHSKTFQCFRGLPSTCQWWKRSGIGCTSHSIDEQMGTNPKSDLS